MTPFEFGQFVGRDLEKHANKGKFLASFIRPAAGAATDAATAAARRVGPSAAASAVSVKPQWIRANELAAKGINPATGLKPGAKFAPPPVPPKPPRTAVSPAQAAATTPAAQAQSFYDNATSGGRQRMLGIDPQGRGVPSAPQSWAQLSPAQQTAAQTFYSGGK